MANRKSTMKSGRTIGEARERLETASERAANHKKAKRQKILRIVFTVIGFGLFAAFCLWLIFTFILPKELDNDPTSSTITVPLTPTIEIIDEDANITGGHLTSRMQEYIGQVESDLREFDYTPIKAVIPTGAIREVDFYLDGYTGFIKTTIDRGAGVSAEDTDRMLRYLAENGITDFQYIDVRVEGRAYWK